MQEEAKQSDIITPEIQEVTRNLVAAFRAVKLYPPNNPIYAQSVHKAFETLDGYLQTAPNFPLGVQKSFFLFEDIPVAKESQVNRGIAQDIFTKGIREVVFHAGVNEEELVELCRALALLPEEMAMRSGIVSILWEKSVTHIKVTEAALEEVITAPGEGGRVFEEEEKPPKIDASVAAKELHFKGRTLVLGEMLENPRDFGRKMLEIAQQTLGENQTVEDRLHELYQEAGRHIREEDAKDQEALFRGLARSVLEMEDHQYRDKFISSKLYAHLDSEHLRQQAEGKDEQLPEELHEIVTGRFSQEWSVKQIATLLKKTSQQKPEPRLPLVLPSELESNAITDEIVHIARELTDYTPEEMEELRAVSEVGTESDIIEAAVRTLIFLLPLVRNKHRAGPVEIETNLFSGVVHQLEITLMYLLKNKEYDLATIIVRALHIPVDPAFQPRLETAIKKASSREIITAVVNDMRLSQKSSPAYLAAYAYLTVLDQEATTVLLETLAAEKDRAIRRYLLDILKELGKNQIAKIGRRITDNRWYVVRNVVHILGESRSEEAVGYLEKVADHTQAQIRNEVIKGLILIGGKKAAGLLRRFLRDKNRDIQLQALRGMGNIAGTGPDEARFLEEFLREHPVKKKYQELSIEGIRALGRIGDENAAVFLQRYMKLRWWRSRKLQEELRTTALASVDLIQRRQGNVGSTD